VDEAGEAVLHALEIRRLSPAKGDESQVEDPHVALHERRKILNELSVQSHKVLCRVDQHPVDLLLGGMQSLVSSIVTRLGVPSSNDSPRVIGGMEKLG
jgi:hypothetical protein